MSSKELKLNDLPAPDELTSDKLPSPADLGAPEELKNTPGLVEALLRGGVQGISFGHGDELTAGMESALTDKPYEQAVKESRANYSEAEKAHPIANVAGNIGGGIGGAALAALAGPALGIGGGIAEGGALGLSALQKLANAAKIGGAMGAATGLGSSEHSLLNEPLDVAKDVASGTALGAGGGAVLSGMGQVAGKGLDQLRKIGAIDNIVKSFQVGKEGTSYFMPKDVAALETKSTEAATKARDAMQSKLANMGSAKRAMLEEAAISGKSADILPDINKAKQSIERLTTDEITGADKSKLNSILNAIPEETDYRNLTPDKIDNIKRMFSTYTKLGDKSLQTPEARKIAQDMVTALDTHVMNSVDDATAQKALTNLSQSNPEVAQDAMNYLSKSQDGVSAIKKLNSGMSKMMTAQDVLGQTNTGNKADQISEVEKLRKIFGRTASESEAGAPARQALDQVKDIIKNVSPELAEQSFAPAEELGKKLQVGKYAKGQIHSGPLGLFGLGNIATVGGANVAGNAYGAAEALSTPLTSSFKAMSNYAKQAAAGQETFMTRALDKIASTADENRRKAMVNTLMQNPYYRQELAKIKKGLFGEGDGDGNETK